MTRRILAALAAALMLAAPGARAQKFQWGDVLTVDFPDGWLMRAGDADNTDTYKYLVTAYDEAAPTGLNVTVETDYYEERADVDLSDAGEGELDAYLRGMLAEYAASGPGYVGRVDTLEGGLPFLIFEGANSFGPFRQAESCVNGTVIKLFGYAYAEENETNRAWTDADSTQFEAIIQSVVVFELFEEAPLTLDVAPAS